MSGRDFAPIADSLRREVTHYFRERGESLTDPAGLNTLETNSGLVERRGAPLLAILRRDAGIASIEGLRVLDAGCGFGALAAFFAAGGAEVVGIDPNPGPLEVGRAVAAEHRLSVQLRRGRMQAMELPDAGFDLVVHNNSFCYVVPRAGRRRALAEALRVLRPGAPLIVRNPNRWYPIDRFTGLPLVQLLPPQGAERVAAALGRRRSPVRVVSSPAAVRELRSAGFSEVRHVSPPNRSWPSAMKPWARYQHFLARRPR